MGPELKSNILLSGVSAVLLTTVFYFWSRGDKERPTVKTHAKVLITGFGVNFLLFYALHKKMIPTSLSGCPAMSGKGGGSAASAPWGGAVTNSGSSSSSSSLVGSQSIAPNPAKFTAVNLNEPSF
jgi:hypothetical protein